MDLQPSSSAHQDFLHMEDALGGHLSQLLSKQPSKAEGLVTLFLLGAGAFISELGHADITVLSLCEISSIPATTDGPGQGLKFDF